MGEANYRVVQAGYGLIPFGLLYNRSILWVAVVILVWGALRTDSFQRPNYGWWSGIVFLFPVWAIIPALWIDAGHGQFWAAIRYIDTLTVLFLAYILMEGTSKRENLRVLFVVFVGLLLTMVITCIGFGLYNGFAFADEVLHQWDFTNTTRFYSEHSNSLFNWGFLTYAQLTKPIGIDPMYFGLLVLMGLLIILNEYPNLNSLPLKVLAFIVFGFFGLFILLLGAKLPILGFLVLTLIQVFRKLLDGSVAKSKRIYALLILVMVLALFLSLPATVFRFRLFAEELIRLFDGSAVSPGSVSRPFIWQTAWKVAMENPLWGDGLIGGRLNLKEAYLRLDLPYFNAHNEWINYFLTGGMLGLLMFLTGVWLAAKKMMTCRHGLMTFFVLILVAVMCIENIFTRFFGCAFYAMGLFLYRYIKLEGIGVEKHA